jgi:hypothetical protein
MEYVQNRKTHEILSLTSVSIKENNDFTEFTIKPGIHGFLSVVIIMYSALFAIFSLIILTQMIANFAFSGTQVLIMVFLLFFLILSGLLLYFALRPTRPQRISLFPEYMDVDTGISRIQTPKNFFDEEELFLVFKNAKRREFRITPETALHSQLTTKGNRKKLTFYDGSKNVEIAATTSNAARECILRYIQEFYQRFEETENN